MEKHLLPKYPFIFSTEIVFNPGVDGRLWYLILHNILYSCFSLINPVSLIEIKSPDEFLANIGVN